MTEATRPPSNSLTGDATTTNTAASAATTGKNGAIGEFMKCMKRGDVVGVEQLARVSYDRDRMILHRALAHGRPRVRPPKYASLYGSFAPRPPWVPCVRILLNLPGITETFSCLYEGKSITSLAAFHREREAAEVMQLLFKAGADPNGIEGYGRPVSISPKIQLGEG
ncbi:hypothetical protein Pelo_18795 [Pelomyxa schiedti]|nr:hypothetical protein Pelo_18795 [Pelomyxa schiedti]